MATGKKWKKLDEVRAEREAVAAKARQRIEGVVEYGLEPTNVLDKLLNKDEWVIFDVVLKETK